MTNPFRGTDQSLANPFLGTDPTLRIPAEMDYPTGTVKLDRFDFTGAAHPDKIFVYPERDQIFSFQERDQIFVYTTPDEIVVDLSADRPGDVEPLTPQKTSTFSFVDAAQYPSQYYLELYDDPTTAPIDTVKCPYVNGLTMGQPLAVQRTWVFDGMPYEEHSGYQQRTFTVTGRSGYSFVDLGRFAKFRNFFEKYAQLSRENKNAFERLLDIRMALNFPWEGEAYWCTPINFQYMRTVANSRVSFEYQLTLVTNGVAALRWDPNGALGYTNYKDGLEESLALAFAEVANAPSPIQGIVRPPPLPELGSLASKDVNKRENNLRQSRMRSKLPLLRQEVEQASATIRQRMAEADAVTRAQARPYADNLLRYYLSIRIRCEMMAGVMGQRIDDPPTATYTSTPSRVQASTDRGHTVGIVIVSGETSAYDVAQRYLGNRAYWVEVVRLNHMVDARTKNDGSVLLGGDQLLIPLAGGAPNIGEVYGTSFLIRDGDLVADGDQDVALVSGVENLYQNLRHRLLTVRGQNKPYRNFGLPQLVGTANTTDVPGQVLSNVKRQVLADHRIKAITELTLVEEGDKLTVDFAIETAVKDRARQKFEYPL